MGNICGWIFFLFLVNIITVLVQIHNNRDNSHLLGRTGNVRSQLVPEGWSHTSLLFLTVYWELHHVSSQRGTSEHVGFHQTLAYTQEEKDKYHPSKAHGGFQEPTPLAFRQSSYQAHVRLQG